MKRGATNFEVRITPEDRYATDAAELIARALPPSGSFVLTGGGTAAKIYPELAAREPDLSHIEILFSDERCVPPDDPRSNFGLTRALLLDRCAVGTVHRMRGEEAPPLAADEYSSEIAGALEGGIDLTILGMGSDCHIASMFPGSHALTEVGRSCVAVSRPDGLAGLTLTPPVLMRSRRILLIVAGADKVEAVGRALNRHESPQTCPVKILADHPRATFLLDEAAASGL